MAKQSPGPEWIPYARQLGTELQRLRIARGLSQEHLAYAAGITRYTYQKLERGESSPGSPANPSLRNIMAIAQQLDVTLDELLPKPWPDLGG
ncbi:helix-turn-helix domain-containing protein [Leucobacter sp. wl10]|uniref:helix-turn-helix domain-containing protein n=1 Tax=Leucobacter sp. wl10 TaxID=2304677 RepID=UPI000E5ADB76|nr:helix-turn-helix transcriptional regulator [Leucobacter sp. wl10]RGE19813.1 XRE family transcriptional regulator [Leucobacter sp. wl10]